MNDAGTTQKASDIVYFRIKEKILDLHIHPGDSISELAISKELGIGRTPVREALKKLEQEGILITVNGRKKVPSLSTKDISEIFEIKIAIETMFAINAAKKITSKRAKQLSIVMNKMASFQTAMKEQISQHNNLQEWLILDKEFHSIIAQINDNKRADSIINSLNLQWHRWRMGIMAMEGRVFQSTIEHIQIGKAIIEGNSDESGRLMNLHLQNLYNTIITIATTFNLA